MFTDNYHCIVCKSNLTLVGDAAQCVSCGAKYPNADGVLLFSHMDPQCMADGSSVDKTLHQSLSLAKTTGCINVLKEVARDGYNNAFK